LERGTEPAEGRDRPVRQGLPEGLLAVLAGTDMVEFAQIFHAGDEVIY